MTQPQQQQQQKKKIVVFDNDGGKDDMSTLSMLITGHLCSENENIASKILSSSKMKWNPIELKGITIVEADCFLQPAADAMRRMLALASFANASSSSSSSSSSSATSLLKVPVFESPLKGAAVPFPTSFRRSSTTISLLPLLNSRQVNERLAQCDHAQEKEQKKQSSQSSMRKEGHEALARLVMTSEEEKIHLVATGPLTNIAYCLKKYGKEFADKIEKIIVMGGAVLVPGNVLQRHMMKDDNLKADALLLLSEKEKEKQERVVDGSAEWNIFFDAPSAKYVLEHELLTGSAETSKIILFSLDSTNSVPITEEVLKSFGELTSKVLYSSSSSSSANVVVEPIPVFAQIAGTAWAQHPYFPRENAPPIYAWDLLCSAYLLDESICETTPIKIKVVAESGSPSEGRTAPSCHEKEEEEKEEKRGGGTVLMAKNVDANKFYEMMRAACSL